jgi:molecular chaperone GrpE
VSSHHDKDKEKTKEHRAAASQISERLSAIAAEESDSPAVSSPAAEEPGATSFAEQIEKLTADKLELTNTLLRRQADFDNFRKRVEKERQQDRHRGIESIVESILPVLDAFDLALAGEHDDPAYTEYRKGFELIRRQLWDILSKQGVSRIEATGKEFNPHIHHAIGNVETVEHAEGTVVDELQPGYLFSDRVLRPAMVRVAASPERKSARTSKS